MFNTTVKNLYDIILSKHVCIALPAVQRTTTGSKGLNVLRLNTDCQITYGRLCPFSVFLLAIPLRSISLQACEDIS